MRTKIIFIWCAVCLSSYGCSSIRSDNASLSIDWLPLSEEAQKAITDDYVDALDEFAQVMPKFALDTEAYWAADTVHAMATFLKSNNVSFLEKYATISQMQNYTAYGMAYFSAIMAMAVEPDWANYTLRFLQKTDSMYVNLKDDDYNDVKTLCFLQIGSYFNMQLYGSLNCIIHNIPINGDIEGVLMGLNVIDSIAEKKDYSDTEIFKIASIIESYSFFQMACPLLKLFAGSKEKFENHYDIIYAAAYYYDAKWKPLYQAVEHRKRIKTISNEEFEEWMITASKHKVKLLKLLTQLVREWERPE